jgi:hypothetical protein
MKILLFVLCATILLSLFLAPAALASDGVPLGSCPVGFELHEFMHHTGEHMHRHIGITQDLNGDGFICMKMLPNDLHLHADNSLPLP